VRSAVELTESADTSLLEKAVAQAVETLER
jgi:hypothetical protein